MGRLAWSSSVSISCLIIVQCSIRHLLCYFDSDIDQRFEGINLELEGLDQELEEGIGFEDTTEDDIQTNMTKSN